MRSATRFAIAIHILSLLEMSQEKDISSDRIAGSIGVNAVIVRNITALLRQARLVHTQQGVSGAQLTRPATEITLLDVYQAVETDDELFPVHAHPNPNCPVGANIQTTLTYVFREAQQAMEARLGATTLAQVVQDLRLSTVEST